MIPGVLVDYLGRATVGLAGSREASLVPHAHRVSGWMVEEDRETMTVLLGRQFTRGLIPSLEENGRFAVTVTEVPTHETYQFKGAYVGSRPVSDSDLTLFRAYRERMVERLCTVFGFPEENVRLFVPVPTLAVSFRVREIFLQTPGPGAGRRLVPSED